MNPKFFDKLNATQTKNMKIGLLKEKHAEDRGFNLIQIWEDDINNNWQEVSNRILEVAKNGRTRLL